MSDRAKQLISDMKNKINRLETELQITTAELIRLEEDLPLERRMQPTANAVSLSRIHVAMFVVVFISVFVAVFLGQIIQKFIYV